MKAAHHKDPNVEALKRIVALLLSLAGLARRASAHSAPMRFLVQFVIGRAETAVLAFIGVPAEEARPRAHGLPGPSDLLLLSARLHTLALLLAQACRMDPRTGETRPVPSALPALLAILPLPLPLAPFHDTS
ncbi:hypothetical protein GRZ55_05170 [Chelativorans sp. ZYF759]|uniref:hypothetical protein n=1 Tax=Chelativorans sp. ZYF759 TaxID=2692213 RepID=UPI00145ED049|nr:hypothetical protein [Chelativorans sp. ZYF759]NMG38634.1 hypothetical protein [Chelativorans sp. ZYF759]